jgi:hypothetical protein
VKIYIFSVALHGAEIKTLREVYQKCFENFEIWSWRKMEKISWTVNVGNDEVLLRVKEDRNILHTVKRRKGNWIGHSLRRNEKTL